MTWNAHCLIFAPLVKKGPGLLVWQAPRRPALTQCYYCRPRPPAEELKWDPERTSMGESTRLDPLTVRERSERMSRVRSKDTKPEMRVRRLVHGLGYRYRLHARDLPGRPDLVFRPRCKVIFVHGCFWHRHEGCSRNRIPKSPERRQFWRDKLDGNVRRDRRNQAALREMGWDVLVIWECETKGESERLIDRIRAFLR